MEDRRKARIGTVSGLAFLAGSTALVAVSGGHHSVFAVLLLGLLALMMSHALIVEIQRQARRRSQVTWYRTDTVNTALLACWALIAGVTSTAHFASLPTRALSGVLAAGYTAACIYFVVERRRAVAAPLRPAPTTAVPGPAPVSPAVPSPAAPCPAPASVDDPLTGPLPADEPVRDSAPSV